MPLYSARSLSVRTHEVFMLMLEGASHLKPLPDAIS